ncbi:MAG: hypothetical protein J6K63_04010 [Clostridia bacterium]|nr:hypothetical protein [Clostridia bacterium]
MYTKRKILIFGQKEEAEETVILLRQYFEKAKKSFQYTVSDVCDECYKQLVDSDPTLVIVLVNGAMGLECVFQTKKYDSTMTVFWFSDDQNFSMQSHRLECAYFAEKPLTAEKLDKAFFRCKSLGIGI